jgi:hypothetical protein
MIILARGLDSKMWMAGLLTDMLPPNPAIRASSAVSRHYSTGLLLFFVKTSHSFTDVVVCLMPENETSKDSQIRLDVNK